MKGFSKYDVQKILLNRFIIIMGDSVQRAVYKDIVLLLQEDRTLHERELRNKGENSFMGDELIEGGRKGKMHNGIAYKEVRQYCVGKHLVRFYFVTRCYNNYVESILTDVMTGPKPDVIIANSCLWDMTRYGRNAIEEYKENLRKLFNRFSVTIPKTCLVVWNTTLPISSSARGGFLVPEIQFMTTTLRLDILEANLFAQQIAVSHNFDVLDLHFYLRNHLTSRGRDGIHWDFEAHRRISCMLLCHICEAWDLPLPQRDSFKSYGSQAVRRANPSTFRFGSGNNFQPQQNYARSSSLNQLRFTFGNDTSFENRVNFNRLNRGLNGSQTSFRSSNEMKWQPYQQRDCHGYEPSSSRSQRNNPYQGRRGRY